LNMSVSRDRNPMRYIPDYWIFLFRTKKFLRTYTIGATVWELF